MRQTENNHQKLVPGFTVDEIDKMDKISDHSIFDPEDTAGITYSIRLIRHS